MPFAIDETPSPDNEIPLINLSVDPDYNWSVHETVTAIEEKRKRVKETIEEKRKFLKETEEEKRKLLKEENKIQLTNDFMDSIDSADSDLSGEEIFDCFKGGISSAYDYAKKEYDKYKYLAEKVGIE